jgi:hypothetical protein
MRRYAEIPGGSGFEPVIFDMTVRVAWDPEERVVAKAPSEMK